MQLNGVKLPVENVLRFFSNRVRTVKTAVFVRMSHAVCRFSNRHPFVSNRARRRILREVPRETLVLLLFRTGFYFFEPSSNRQGSHFCEDVPRGSPFSNRHPV